MMVFLHTLGQTARPSVTRSTPGITVIPNTICGPTSTLAFGTSSSPLQNNTHTATIASSVLVILLIATSAIGAILVIFLLWKRRISRQKIQHSLNTKQVSIQANTSNFASNPLNKLCVTVFFECCCII